MKNRRLLLSALVLLSLSVTACNFSNPFSFGSSGSGDDTSTDIEDESSLDDSEDSYADDGEDSSNQPSGNTSAQSSQQSSSSSKQDETPSNFTFNESTLNTPQEIHTANQKAYLNYSGDYYHITESQLTSFGMSGRSNVSDPNKVTLSWNYSVPSGKSVSKYSIIYGQKQDLSDGYKIDGTTAKSISFYNPYLGDNYFKVIATFSDNSTEESPVKIFKVDTQAPRNLYVGGMPNVRDTGGRTTYAGGKIKQGLIYRGAGSSSLNDDGRSILLNQLKIKTEINVADSTSYNLNLTNVQIKNCYMAYGTPPYSNLSRNADRVREVMDILSNESNYPIFYHCRIGTDRTGITGMMISGLIGIPFNEIFQDYCFSNFASIDGQRYANKADDPNGDDPAKYIEEIKKMPGANYQEKTYNALLAIGCKPATLNKIIDIMTEGNKATLPTTAKIGMGNDLSFDSPAKTASDYKSPDTYYQVTSGKKISYTVTTTSGDKNVVVYLGSTDSSSSKMLSNCIALKIDNASKSIADKTLLQAGFGTTSSKNGSEARGKTGYMFQVLGKYSLTAGSHTFEISVSSGTFNIATIDVFDYVAEA